MIPKVKLWNVVDKETGKLYQIETITRKMVKIIMGMDYPETWGHRLKITSVNQYKL